jgi:hypothetical protein
LPMSPPFWKNWAVCSKQALITYNDRDEGFDVR